MHPLLPQMLLPQIAVSSPSTQRRPISVALLTISQQNQQGIGARCSAVTPVLRPPQTQEVAAPVSQPPQAQIAAAAPVLPQIPSFQQMSLPRIAFSSPLTQQPPISAAISQQNRQGIGARCSAFTPVLRPPQTQMEVAAPVSQPPQAQIAAAAPVSQPPQAQIAAAAPVSQPPQAQRIDPVLQPPRAQRAAASVLQPPRAQRAAAPVLQPSGASTYPFDRIRFLDPGGPRPKIRKLNEDPNKALYKKEGRKIGSTLLLKAAKAGDLELVLKVIERLQHAIYLTQRMPLKKSIKSDNLRPEIVQALTKFLNETQGRKK